MCSAQKKFCAALRQELTSRISNRIHTRKGTAMIGYVLFLVFWAVFALGYYLRDPSQDAAKTRSCDLW